MPAVRERRKGDRRAPSPERGDRRAMARARTRALEPILQTISDGIAVVDREGVFLVFNEAAERILGVGSMDVPPSEWPEVYGLFLPDRATPYPSEQLPLVRASRGEAVHDAEIYVRGPNRPDRVLASLRSSGLMPRMPTSAVTFRRWKLGQ